MNWKGNLKKIHKVESKFTLRSIHMLLTKMINFLKQINLVVNFRSLSNIVDQREGTQGIDQRSSKAHAAI